jgi:hypothetical protein
LAPARVEAAAKKFEVVGDFVDCEFEKREAPFDSPPLPNIEELSDRGDVFEGDDSLSGLDSEAVCIFFTIAINSSLDLAFKSAPDAFVSSGGKVSLRADNPFPNNPPASFVPLLLPLSNAEPNVDAVAFPAFSDTPLKRLVPPELLVVSDDAPNIDVL